MPNRHKFARNNKKTPHTTHWTSIRARFIAVGFALAAVHALAGSAPSEGEKAGRVIQTIQQFWNLTSEVKAVPQPFELVCDVTYSDPKWKILFVQDTEGQGAFVPYGDNPYPFRSGERIVASGETVPPGVDLSFANAAIRPIGKSWPKPLDITSRVAQAERYANQVVAVEGLVDQCTRLNPNHLELHLSVEGMPVVSWITMQEDDPTPDLTDAIVRVEGACNPKIGPDKILASLEIMVPGLEHLTVRHHLDQDPRFEQSPVPIGSLYQLPTDAMVMVVGRVKDQQAGRFVQIRDSSGQVTVQTGQAHAFALNEFVKAVGYPRVDGTDWKLTRGILRSENRDHDKQDTLSAFFPAKSDTIRLAAQVLELPPEDAMHGWPVSLTGVVTWSHPDAPFFFVQDSSGGICVLRDQTSSPVQSPGRNLEIQGITAMGRFAPVVKATRFTKASDTVLPVARPTSLDIASTGREEAQWIEMRGYLRRIYAQSGWNNLEIVTPSGDFVAILPPSVDLSHLVGAVVRLQGVCTANADAQRKLTGIKLWVPSGDYVQVEEPAPENPFDVPVRSLASLGQFSSRRTNGYRIRVSGVVLQQVPGHSIHVQDGESTLLIYSRKLTPLAPGDRIDAVGFPGRESGRIVLLESVYRRTGKTALPIPQTMDVHHRPDTSQDGRLVSMAASLIDASRIGNRLRLTMQVRNTIFEAYLEPIASHHALRRIAPGSQLSLTGVYEVMYDEDGHPANFHLDLRSPADVTVLRRPSWWTRGRTLGFTSALAFGTLLFIAWITALRRRVRAQTDQIRQQLKRESQLETELQRAGKLESLGLLAGGIAHDFNNLLTAVMGNLSLARLDAPKDSPIAESIQEAEKAVVRARDLTQQLLTFAKGGAPIRTAVSLPEVIREVVEFALHGSNSLCEFDIAADLWAANADKGQLGQVMQNIAINSMQAMPEGGILHISLENAWVGPELSQVLAPGRYILLTATDHGQGIPPEELSRIFDPYFTTRKMGSGLGLATVHSIIKKHLGHISVESTLSEGTTFRIWLPAAEQTSALPEAPVEIQQSPHDSGSARILFMDDEESIRRIGGAILQRLGYEVTTVADGAAAVQEYGDARKAGRPYSLVILDLTIPGGMGGKQTMEKLLQMDPDVKAIVSSGYSNDLVLSNYAAHGFIDMVSKPYEIADLARIVEQALLGERV